VIEPSVRYGEKTYPIYQFTVDGRNYEVKGAAHKYKPQVPAVGSMKEVAYPPNDPGQARVVYNIGWALWGLSGLGLFVFVMAAYLYRVTTNPGRAGMSWHPINIAYSQVKFYKKFWFLVTSVILFPLGPFLVLLCNRHLYRTSNGRVYESGTSHRITTVALGVLTAVAIIQVWVLLSQ
jgi:hypothetical protein